MNRKRPLGKYDLSRRTVLRGLCGGAAVALGLPMLEAMLSPNGNALADGDPLPRRFMTWFFGNGVQIEKWVPTKLGPRYDLPSELAPLAGVQDYCSVLSGFDNFAGKGGYPHHGGAAGMLSGHPYISIPASGAYASKFGGPSIDQVAASFIGGETFLPSLEVAVSKRAIESEGPTMSFVSHKGPDQPIPSEVNPQAVFERLFGSFSTPGDPEINRRVSMLDAVAEDAKRLRQRVGASDKLRLDAHLDSVSLLQKQIKAAAPVCQTPEKPTETNANGPLEPLLSVSTVMSDLVALAFVCDLTRVVSFAHTYPQSTAIFDMTGATEHEHALSHDPNGQDFVHAAVIFNIERFAYLLDRLKTMPEGDGNVLDNSCILLGSDCSFGFDHNLYDTPIIVAGRGGGSLKYPGEHYRSPDPMAPENVSDVLLACLQTVAPEATEVGSGAGYSAAPCAALDA